MSNFIEIYNHIDKLIEELNILKKEIQSEMQPSAINLEEIQEIDIQEEIDKDLQNIEYIKYDQPQLDKTPIIDDKNKGYFDYYDEKSRPDIQI